MKKKQKETKEDERRRRENAEAMGIKRSLNAFYEENIYDNNFKYSAIKPAKD